MNVFNDENSQGDSAEEHKAEMSEPGDKTLSSFSSGGYRGKMSGNCYESVANSAYINPEGRPSYNLDYDVAYQKNAKNSLDEGSTDESPSDPMRKCPP